MPSARERALRLAKDTVAAANFFEFTIHNLFEHLLGWDYNAHTSSEKDGILRHLAAFYGTGEFTERGCLHGHFLIWLAGGLNPSDIHSHLEASPGYQAKFFQFFESIIYHHLPDLKVDISPSYDPRIERPPLAPDLSQVELQSNTSLLNLEPNVAETSESYVLLPSQPSQFFAPRDTDKVKAILAEWETICVTEIKKCGEVLQRHQCCAVCHKYGNENQCWFLFPHEIVEASYYDPETKSIVLLCQDGNVNYFNPYILVFCQHNYDIKCILSGKSAKAAMFYITDYITKMDVKTYEILSLMSQVVAQISTVQTGSPLEGTKQLLHRCLSQFTRRQQIHAQQAVRYLQGHGDGIPSHKTTPMLSSMLVSFLKNVHKNVLGDTENENFNLVDNDDIEPDIGLQIKINTEGQLIDTTQIYHYWLREDTLSNMSFYNFCCFVRLEKKSRSAQVKNTHETRLGVFQRHELKPEHPLSKTHHLIEHTNLERGDGLTELIPCVVGMSIPRETHANWPLFALAHFKPFSLSNLLIPPNSSINNEYKTFQFSSMAKNVMKNWNAIHECEDQRDADRLRKRETLMKESQVMIRAVAFQDDDIINLENWTTANNTKHEADFKMWNTVVVLTQAQWFKPSITQVNQKVPCSSGKHQDEQLSIQTDLVFSHKLLQEWKAEIKYEEKRLAEKQKNALNPDSQNVDSLNHSSETEFYNHIMIVGANSIKETTIPKPSDSMYTITSEEILHQVSQEFQLNTKQLQAFHIIAKHYVNKYIQHLLGEKPLHMLMTGPGGTGKTHVVKAVKKVMSYYACDHKIRFLAPTGSAAGNINGMTIHKGLGIKITKKDGRGKGNQEARTSLEDYTVLVSIQNKTQLRDEWRNVDLVLIDEISLGSAQLLCEIDHALRFAKEQPNEWFGGMTIIFAGDFYQYPPVGGTPLFTPIGSNVTQSNDELMKCLGWLAWKSVNTVIELIEQQRMKDDIEYAAAVQYLHVRSCTDLDVEIFNSRIIKSDQNPSGVDMGISDNIDAVAIVNTNCLHEVLNIRKAQSMGGNQLTMCAARDTTPSLTVPLT
ncbi:hypothetical protein D9756_001995 [Leucocoprinus leucothites]|uniref:ATP-dependent DNA helicase n=1 Tax=Leucocoprinus leucothites TaxID=201217 RepID=A0A8H5GC16_9AGAR|nr:hypothetical protein D9756_001995 [Leucoagaricus leucothites]